MYMYIVTRLKCNSEICQYLYMKYVTVKTHILNLEKERETSLLHRQYVKVALYSAM